MSKKIVIIDYGLGNVKSIYNALVELGEIPTITSDAVVILKADALILPGVGAFKQGMDNLNRMGLSNVILSFAATGKPLLGICLGMQMLLDESDEFGKCKGLGIIPGRVEKLSILDGSIHKLPHVSWNEIIEPCKNAWRNSLLSVVNSQNEVYFVHSYVAVPSNNDHILSLTNYGGSEFVSAINKDNIYGFQFHPEKSGKLGLKILSNYIKSINI